MNVNRGDDTGFAKSQLEKSGCQLSCRTVAVLGAQQHPCICITFLSFVYAFNHSVLGLPLKEENY